MYDCYGGPISFQSLLKELDKYEIPAPPKFRKSLIMHPQEFNPRENIAQITDRLFLSDLSSAECPTLLRRLHITRVISIVDKSDMPFVYAKHLKIMMQDSPKELISKYFNVTFNFIEQNTTGNTLVHCFAGVSRSATIVIAFIMRRYRWSFELSCEYVQNKRPQVQPNSGFWKQLKTFGLELYWTKKRRKNLMIILQERFGYYEIGVTIKNFITYNILLLQHS
jgi:hypothetical protein